MPPNPFARDPAVTVGVGADTSGFTSAMDGAISQLGSLKGAVAGAGVALGALAVGGMAKATQAAAAFEEQLVEVEKVTDPQTAREMGAAIQEMADEMPVAHEELSTIAATAGRLGVEGTENIKEFTRVTSEMAIATDLAAEDAADSFARMTTLLNEDIKNVRSLGDAVNELSNNMAASSTEIVDAATRSSGVLTQLGLTSEQVLGLNAAMNEVSASSRLAGTQLRRFGQELQDPGKAEDLASALGMTVEEFRSMREESPNELILEMAETFGAGGEAADDLRSSLSTTSRQTLAGLSQNMESLMEAQGMANEQFETGGSLAEEYEAAASTFNSELQVTRNRIRTVAIQIGENLLPVASTMLGHFNTALTTFSEFNERTNGMAGTVALTAGALGGLTAAAGVAVSALGGLAAVKAAVGAGLAALTGPIGIAIAGVALLTGAWTSNFLGIRDVTADVTGAIEDNVGTIRAVALTLIGPAGWAYVAWDKNFLGIQNRVADARAWITENFDLIKQAAIALTGPVGWLYLAWKHNLWGIQDTTDEVADAVTDSIAWILDRVEEVPDVVRRAIDQLPGVSVDELFPPKPGAAAESNAESAGQAAGEQLVEARKEAIEDEPVEPFPSPEESMAAGEAAGREWASGLQSGVEGPIKSSGLTPRLRDFLRVHGDDFGMKTRNLEDAPTEITPELFRGMVEREVATLNRDATPGMGEDAIQTTSGVSASDLGISAAEFNELARRAGFDDMGSSPRRSPGVSQRGGGGVGAGPGSGFSVSDFASAVRKALEGVALTLELRTRDETLADIIETEVQAEIVQQSQLSKLQ